MMDCTMMVVQSTLDNSNFNSFDFERHYKKLAYRQHKKCLDCINLHERERHNKNLIVDNNLYTQVFKLYIGRYFYISHFLFVLLYRAERNFWLVFLQRVIISPPPFSNGPYFFLLLISNFDRPSHVDLVRRHGEL